MSWFHDRISGGGNWKVNYKVQSLFKLNTSNLRLVSVLFGSAELSWSAACDIIDHTVVWCVDYQHATLSNMSILSTSTTKYFGLILSNYGPNLALVQVSIEFVSLCNWQELSNKWSWKIMLTGGGKQDYC